ncbi:MAG TPA: ParB/RepB/Spo0J family partition protein [Candidatus Nitrosocosmicus sp.]|nr:ParB/RepB/Spo0J family partition protein [Candidatus Nitrosocosmicus sp.]
MTLNAQPYSSRFIGQIDNLSIKDITLPKCCLRMSYSYTDIRDILISIKIDGLLQPIIVRPKDNGLFEIVAGCRRYLSCKSLGWKKIPCHIMHLNDRQAYEISLIENVNRNSITPLEEAAAFKNYVYDNGWGSIQELANKMGTSPSYISKRIALLDLPADIQDKIEKMILHPSSAEELFQIKNHEKQSELANLISKRHLSIKQIRRKINEDPYYCENSENIDVRSELQSFNKTVIALRIALNRISDIIEEDEGKDNLLISEMLSYNARVLRDQIDYVLRTKKKYAKNVFKYRLMTKN